MNRHVDVIEILRSANPVPLGAVQDEPPPLEELLRSLLERNDVMSSTSTKPEVSRESRPGWPKSWRLWPSWRSWSPSWCR